MAVKTAKRKYFELQRFRISAAQYRLCRFVQYQPSAASGSRIHADLQHMVMKRGVVSGFVLTIVLCSSTADAQPETFLPAVAQLAQAASQPQASRFGALLAAADRMADALAEWDRRIAVHEAELAGKHDASADSYKRHIEWGVTYRRRGRFTDALRELDAAIGVDPRESEAQLFRALTLEAMNRSEEAARAFAAAWKLDVRNPVTAYYLLTRPSAGTAMDAMDRERARNLLTETYQRDRPGKPAPRPFITLDPIPDNLSRAPIVGDSSTAEAFTLITQARFTEAITALRQQSDATPPARSDDVPLLHFLLGQQSEREGDVASARRHYQRALTGALLGRSVLYLAIARLAQVEGDPAAAVDALLSAVRLNPNDPYLHKELAAAYASLGRVDDAFCELVAALLLDPGDAHAHATIGQLFLDAERYRDSVQAFTRVLELKPDAFEARYGLATALARMGNSAEAARQLEQFERARREAQEQRRRDIIGDVDPQQPPQPRPASQDGAR
jgi:tetratricopeptide (TPR) repeat protein